MWPIVKKCARNVLFGQKDQLKGELVQKNEEIVRLNMILGEYKEALTESIEREKILSDENRALWKVLEDLNLA
jgi:hypothetical protein